MRRASARRGGGALVSLVLLSGLAVLAGCTPAPQRIQESLFVFGSEARIELLGVPAAQAQPALAEIAAELQSLHSEWHAWEPSAVTALNAELAAGRAAPLPPRLLHMVERSLTLAGASGGLFDPTVGGLMRLWGFHTSEFPITSPAPSAAQIEIWRKLHPSFDDLQLDGAVLSSRNPAVQLDFGAIAEGMATERIVDILQRHGIRRALITLGGDLYALGSAEDRPWRAALRDPFNAGDQPLALVDLHDGEALYSSGNYNRYRESPTGTRWPHVVDPRSGLPAGGIVGVNVLHPDPVIADAASTALMVAGEAGFESVLRRMGVRCALLLTEHNEIMLTAAMAARLDLQRRPLQLGPLVGSEGPCDQPEPPPAVPEATASRSQLGHNDGHFSGPPPCPIATTPSISPSCSRAPPPRWHASAATTC